MNTAGDATNGGMGNLLQELTTLILGAIIILAVVRLWKAYSGKEHAGHTHHEGQTKTYASILTDAGIVCAFVVFAKVIITFVFHTAGNFIGSFGQGSGNIGLS